MKTIILQLAIGATLAHDNVDKGTHLTLFMFMKEDTTVINCVGGGSITRLNHLEGLLNSHQCTSLKSNRLRPLEVVGLISSKPVLAWTTLSKTNLDENEQQNIKNDLGAKTINRRLTEDVQ